MKTNIKHKRSISAIIVAIFLLSYAMVFAESPDVEMLQQAAQEAIATQDGVYEIGTTKIIDEWALISFRQADNQAVQIGLAHWDGGGQWTVALQDSEQFAQWLDQLPVGLMSPEARDYLQLDAPVAQSSGPSFYLPFPPNQTWRYMSGPNGGPYRRAVDFGPLEHYDPVNPYSPFTGQERDVTAAADGVVVDKDTNLLVVRHEHGWETSYFGLAARSIRLTVGDLVQVGDRLGLASNEVEPDKGIRVSFWVRRIGVDQPIDHFQLSGWTIYQDNSYEAGDYAGEMIYLDNISKVDCRTVIKHYLDLAYCQVTHFAQPILQFSPRITRMPQSSTGYSTVEVVNVRDLSQIEFEIVNNPNDYNIPRLDVNDLSPGTIFDGTMSNPIYGWKKVQYFPIITFTAELDSPFSGTGSVLDIKWTGIGETRGETILTLSNVKLTDSKGNRIPATLRDGVLQVLRNALVEGRVQLQTGHAYDNVILHAGGQDLQPDAEGYFSVEMETEETYEVTITAPRHLSVKLEGDSSETTDWGEITLLGGDVTGDDKVDLFDLSYIASHYEGNDVVADLNNDGVVNLFDMVVAATNYGKQGPVVVER